MLLLLVSFSPYRTALMKGPLIACDIMTRRADARGPAHGGTVGGPRSWFLDLSSPKEFFPNAEKITSSSLTNVCIILRLKNSDMRQKKKIQMKMNDLVFNFELDYLLYTFPKCFWFFQLNQINGRGYCTLYLIIFIFLHILRRVQNLF